MTINLFLDANIFLSFYALSNADITQLAQLKGVVSSKTIALFVSDQLYKEVERNRDVKVQEAFKALRDDDFKCHAPSFVKSMKQFDELQSILTNANSKHSELVGIVSKLVENRGLDADKLISEVIAAAGVKNTTEKQFIAAQKRFLVGDPPGKKKVTIGDELNWEFLLESVPTNEDLHFVSIDKDYASVEDPKRFNSFLIKEWSKKKNSQIHFYKDLSEFLKLHVPKIKLANKAKIDSLILELSASRSFARTHEILAKFPDDAEFDAAQAANLQSIKDNNSQVGTISEDADVAYFYKKVAGKH